MSVKQLVECVPNFSEGRNPVVIEAIAAAIKDSEGVQLLDVDPGKDTNRTVMTFVGEPAFVVEAAFNAIKKASELIDMSSHKGAHARIGATDVCPIIPISGISIEQCVEYSKKLAFLVASKLNIPVYLYEYSATSAERTNLANIRKGEYEGLEEKLKDPNWKPDYGPSKFNSKSGATVIGVRDFLIAYNVNLNTSDRKIANDIALNIREAGRAKRDLNGQIVKDSEGKTVNTPGTLKAVKAVGWYIKEYGYAQISMNLTNYKITSVHAALQECRRQAELMGVLVTGSELVGLIPKDALIEAGKYYLQKMGKSGGFPEKIVIETAIRSMGLNETSHFDPAKKIIEYTIDNKNRTLQHSKVSEFLDELSNESMAPGGGSVAALCGALSASLCSMVGHLTNGKKGYENHFSRMKEISDQAQVLKSQLTDAIDDDTDAFNLIIQASKVPPSEKAAAIEAATIVAIEVPLKVVGLSLQAMQLSSELIYNGNQNSLSDAGVACLAAMAAVDGAWMNVMINSKSLTNLSKKEEYIQLANDYRKKAKVLYCELLSALEKKLI